MNRTARFFYEVDVILAQYYNMIYNIIIIYQSPSSPAPTVLRLEEIIEKIAKKKNQKKKKSKNKYHKYDIVLYIIGDYCTILQDLSIDIYIIYVLHSYIKKKNCHKT